LTNIIYSQLFDEYCVNKLKSNIKLFIFDLNFKAHKVFQLLKLNLLNYFFELKYIADFRISSFGKIYYLKYC